MEEVKVETKDIKDIKIEGKGKLVKVTEEPKNNIEFKEKKFSASKVILGVVLFVCFVFASIIIYGWLILQRQDAPLMLSAVLTPAATSIGFYLWKSKVENMIKLKSIYGKLYTAEYELNQNGYGGSYGYGNSFQNLIPYSNNDMDMNGMG